MEQSRAEPSRSEERRQEKRAEEEHEEAAAAAAAESPPAFNGVVSEGIGGGVDMDVASLAARAAAAQGRIDALQAEMQEKDERMGVLAAESADARARVGVLEAQLAQQAALLAEQEALLGQQEARLAEQAHEVVSLQQSLESRQMPDRDRDGSEGDGGVGESRGQGGVVEAAEALYKTQLDEQAKVRAFQWAAGFGRCPPVLGTVPTS